MTPAQQHNFARLLNPRHIAFIGGTDAAIAIGEAQRIGFSGEYWPVNARRESLAGIPCYPSVDALPSAPDAVFLAIPAEPAIAVLAQLRDRGAGGVVCYTAGFGETGTQGKKAEQALVAAAGDMALIGPNCYGMINYLDRVALWPFAHGGTTPGYGCAIITQSGMLSSDLTMSQRSVPLTHMISIGNQAVLTMEDLVMVLCEDSRVRAIGLHIEGLKDVSEFARAAVKATQMGKPIVALKTGSSNIGKALTTSHTGSISGEDDLYDALFERGGVIRVYSPSQLLETLKFVCVAGIPDSTRVAGFTCSGGGATMLADHAEKIGLDFTPFSEPVTKALEELLPPIATVSNPLDYTTPIWGQSEMTRPVFEQAMTSQCDSAVLVQDYPFAGLDESRHFYLADAGAFADAVQGAGIPAAVCSTLPENIDQATREMLIGRGIAPMQGINECLEAISSAAHWRQRHRQIVNQPPADLLSVTKAHAPELEEHRSLDEAQAKQLLQHAGIPVPESAVCEYAQLEEAAAALGFPLALKMIHADLTHKTELGAIALNLHTPAEVADAALKMVSMVRARQPAVCSERFILERMQPPPLAELIVSVRRDEQFGLALTIGAGGVLVELVGDSATLLLPAIHQDILNALHGLKVTRLLQGYRNNPVCDLDMLADCLLSLCQFAEARADQFTELEINPLLVYPGSVCAVDALVTSLSSHENSDS